MHEAQLWDANRFVTLDYAPEHLTSWSLRYRDFQLFMKRLRKAVSGVSPAPVPENDPRFGTRPIRFFVAGEYGAKFRRPHWHALLFNCRFEDEVRFVNGTSRSAQAESIWQLGNVVIGEVTPASAAYVAGYTLSKVYGPAALEHYEDLVDSCTGEVSSRRPEFIVPSRAPGIGAWWYERYSSDLFPRDRAVAEGREFKVPRYYWNKFQREGDPSAVEAIHDGRYERSRAIPLEERSESRRAVRAELATARLMLNMERSH